MMPKAVWNFSFKLRKGVTQDDFMEATEKLHDEIISKQKALFLGSNTCKGILGRIWFFGNH